MAAKLTILELGLKHEGFGLGFKMLLALDSGLEPRADLMKLSVSKS